MAHFITDDCISCAACEADCPNEAIYAAGDSYTFNGQTFAALNDEHTYIVPEKCTDCKGFHDEPMCVSLCPSEAIIVDPNR
ncbi:MAG: 4Fe-4S dicluster domain-containing protein [Ignavibacteriaceae bacterium]|nr:4Fe-4S dicluster domain-containing protein [Ignavibacteriaceae bacterium]NUM70890.1 4Fe-4S dicluster domain-containing protein [Ignavibacteriaceae bacterium]